MSDVTFAIARTSQHDLRVVTLGVKRIRTAMVSTLVVDIAARPPPEVKNMPSYSKVSLATALGIVLAWPAATLAVPVVIREDGAVKSEDGCTLEDFGYSGGTMTIDVSIGCVNTGPSPGITVSPTSLAITENTSANFSVVLQSVPTANVSVSIASSDTTEATVSANTLTFTPLNALTPQSVTVSGYLDGVEDGTQSLTIQTGTAQSTDAGYSGRAVADVAVSVANVSASAQDDPGTNAWHGPSNNQNLWVVNKRPTSGRLFYPNCAKNYQDYSTSNCEFEGSVTANETYSQRIPWGVGPNDQGVNIKIDLASAGETYGTFSGNVSTIPGTRTSTGVTGTCSFTDKVTAVISLLDIDAYNNPAVPSFLKNGCVLQHNTVYYFNFWPSGAKAPNCGSGEICRTMTLDDSGEYHDTSLYPWTIPSQ